MTIPLGFHTSSTTTITASNSLNPLDISSDMAGSADVLKLPDEMLREIILMSLADDDKVARKQLLDLSYTCRRLHNLTMPDIWAKPRIKNLASWKKFSAAIANKEHLTALIKDLNVDLYICYMNYQLEFSEAAKKTPWKWDACRIPVLPNCVRLQLNLGSQSSGRTSNSMPFVEVMHWIASCPSLQALALVRVWSSSFNVRQIPSDLGLQMTKSLVSYEFTQLFLQDDEFEYIWECLPRPRSLRLGTVRFGSGESLDRMADVANDLDMLHLSGSGYGVLVDWAAKAPTLFPQLTKVRYPMLNEINWSVQWKYLKEMDIDVDIVWLGDWAPKSGCFRLLREALDNQRFPSLRKLRVRATTDTQAHLQWSRWTSLDDINAWIEEESLLHDSCARLSVGLVVFPGIWADMDANGFRC